ncbi:hypothetical protein ACEWY4_023016 [Coilia grayii]|uniref:Ig-like domain-containing protein n=1 Tax=Coilia grayii TaxID=363190 RepID=A0ABD1J1S1_9TELE
MLPCFVLGVFTLSGPQEVRATAGETAVISCHYHSFYYDYIKYWCKGYYWNYCTVLIKSNNHIKDNMQITDDKELLTFTIIMKTVRMEDSGWYWCAIERVSKHVKFAVMLTVTAGTPKQPPEISSTSPPPSSIVKVTTSSQQTTSLPLSLSTAEEEKHSPTRLKTTTESCSTYLHWTIWSIWSITRWVLFLALCLYLFCFIACCHLRQNRSKSHAKVTVPNDSFSSAMAAAQQQQCVAHSLRESSVYRHHRQRRWSLE